VVDFFNEVEEDLRADRWRTLFKKYGVAAAGAGVVLLIGVGGVLGYVSWRNQASAKGSEAFERAAKALEQRQPDQAGTGFAETAKSGSAAYKALALEGEAGLALNNNQTDKALDLLDKAARAEGDPIVADEARLKAAYLVMDKSPFNFAEVKKRLGPLMKDGRPYAAYAREALAMAKLQNGQPKDARDDFQHLANSIDPSTSAEVRQRAQVALKMIDGGQTAQMPAMVKAAAKAAATPSSLPAGLPAPQAGAARR
jgi:hypothetical protein